MTRTEMEKLAQALVSKWTTWNHSSMDQVELITAALTQVRNATIAECAKVADAAAEHWNHMEGPDHAYSANDAAVVIRRLSESGSQLFKNEYVSPEDARLAREVNKRAERGES